jgi:trk system potassium uptake protein TrkH
MTRPVIVRTLGLVFLMFSITMLPPLAVSLVFHDGNVQPFSVTIAFAVAVGLLLWWPNRRQQVAVRNREGFLIVTLMWVFMSLLGAVPFMMTMDLGFIDALFESTSGYTTTGSTVVEHLDMLPESILLYRQEIQWLGGIGVIVLAIALLPMLGIGGMQLYKAETPGPFKDDRLTPRIARTARNVCLIYVSFTVACAFCFWLAGMEPFDAVAHSLSTLSTGGYSTHDSSLAFFDSPAIESVAMIFMLVGGISFSTHFVAWRALKVRVYGRDTQIRTMIAVIVLLSSVVAAVLYLEGSGNSAARALRLSVFEVVSVITSTGFGIDDFSVWPLALPVLLIFASFMGGCAGSTGGGMKVVRFVVIVKQAGVHLYRLIHPKVVMPIKVDQRVVPNPVIEGIWGFFTIYITVFAILMVVLMFGGMDQITAFSAVAACLNNLGPGLGSVARDFVAVSAESKLVLVLAMIFGRLEVFTPLVLLTPAFWDR